MTLMTTAGIRSPSLRRRLLPATALMILAGGSSGCAASRPGAVAASPAAVAPLLGDRRSPGSDHVTVIDFRTVRNALRELRSAPSANLTGGQKAAVLGGTILLVLLLLDAMDATDDLAGHIDDPTVD